MAKKSISYGPNTALIAGEATARKYQSGSGGVSAAAFTAGFLSTYEAGVKEQKERDAIRDAYMADLGSIQNINLLDQDYNKQAVTDFVRAKRDEYSKLADAYSKTKDTDLLDKMDAIKFSFSNLNTQLNTLVTERASYLDSFDKGQLIDLPGDEKYTSIYTNKGQFSIEDNGDVGFTTDGKYDKFKDVAGKWNVKNNIGETLTMKTNSTAKQVGEQGGSFYRDDIKNTYTLSFKQTGPEGIMVMAKTDITGDNEFVLPNGQKAGNLSFEAMWSQGLLDDKFYTEFTKDGGSDWMWDKANSDKLNDLISEYYTDVTKSSYDQGKANYKDPNAGKGSDGVSGYFPKGTRWVHLGPDRDAYSVGDANGLIDDIKSGSMFAFNDNKYTYEDGSWWENREEGDTTDSDSFIGSPESLRLNVLKSSDAAFKNLTTEKIVKKDLATGLTIGEETRLETDYSKNISAVDISTMELDDNQVAAAIKLAPLGIRNPKGYQFLTTQDTEGWGLEEGGGDPFKESITLYDANKKRVRYPTGHPKAGKIIEIKTGGNLAKRRRAIKDLDDVLNIQKFGLRNMLLSGAVL